MEAYIAAPQCGARQKSRTPLPGTFPQPSFVRMVSTAEKKTKPRKTSCKKTEKEKKKKC